MELKERMYVRTNEGKITKIIEIDKDGFERVDKCRDFTNYNITKASHNIIDLIEVGDYVNGYKVIEVDFDAEEEKYIRVDKSQDVLKTILRANDIKSIVTQEMFSNVEYRVETN